MKVGLIDDYIPVAVRGEEVVDLSTVLPADILAAPGRYRMNLLIERFAELRERIEAVAATGKGRPLASARLRAPVSAPTQMLFAQGNYHEGLKGTHRPLGLFLKAPSTILD